MATSRQIVMFNRVSADGYYSSPDGNLDWAIQDPDLDKEAANGLDGAGTMLFGRKTYDMFESFWPRALDGGGPTAPNPHRPGHHSPEMRALATWINESRKIVFSTTRKTVTWQNSELRSTFDPEEILALKREPGKNIMIFGSGSIVSALTQHGLIDEYQFVVSPVILGSGGLPIRDISTRLRLKLLEASNYPSGNVKLRYAPA
jgi:dihydrofolate reductase